MKIQIASDLHIEFDRPQILEPATFILPKTDADVIILAGDIGVGFDEERNFCEDIVQEHQKDVIFVLGNHSFYQKGNIDKIRDQWAEWAENAALFGVHYLDDGHCWTYKDTLFIGGILWTDFNCYDPIDMDTAERNMNDYRHTRMYKQDSARLPRWPIKASKAKKAEDDYRREYKLTPCRTADEHYKTKHWIQKGLNNSEHTKRVVVSHHLPCLRSISLEFQSGASSELNPAYASDMEGWIQEQKHINLWVHGHTHDSKDYTLDNGTRVVCNPRGYRGYAENKDFVNDLVVEI